MILHEGYLVKEINFKVQVPQFNFIKHPVELFFVKLGQIAVRMCFNRDEPMPTSKQRLLSKAATGHHNPTFEFPLKILKIPQRLQLDFVLLEYFHMFELIEYYWNKFYSFLDMIHSFCSIIFSFNFLSFFDLNDKLRLVPSTQCLINLPLVTHFLVVFLHHFFPQIFFRALVESHIPEFQPSCDVLIFVQALQRYRDSY